MRFDELQDRKSWRGLNQPLSDYFITQEGNRQKVDTWCPGLGNNLLDSTEECVRHPEEQPEGL